MTGVMHASFSVGLLAGILLASAVVFGSIYASAPTRPVAGPLSTVAGQSKTTTATSTSTAAQVPGAAFVNGLVSTTTSTNSTGGAGANAGGGSSAYSNSAGSVLPSPRLGVLLSQPGQAPILLLPLVVALLLGFALYKASVQKD